MRITKGIFGTFMAKAAVSALGLLLVIFTSRNLGAEGRGVISLMMSLIAFLQLFCDFGSNSALINLSYQYSHRRLLLSSLLWVTCICILSYLPALFFDHIQFIYLVPPAALLYSLVNANNLLLMGNRRVAQRNVVMVMQPLLLLSFFLLFFFGFDLEIQSYPLGLFAALICCSVLSFVLLKDKLKTGKESFSFESQVLKQGAWVQGGHAVQFLNYRINFFIVAYLLNEASLGVYNNVVIIAESIWILGHSMGQMQHMKILNTTDAGEHVALTNQFIRVNFGGTLVLMVVLLILPNGFWTWLFSDEFSDMGGLFVFLAPGVMCFSISNIINHFLHAKNRFREILLCNVNGLIGGLAVSLLLIPEYGLTGACISWSGGLCMSMLTYLFIYKRFLKTS